MADLIQRLQQIDRRRAMLLTHSRRIKLARPFARDSEQRMQRNLDAEFRNLTRERGQVLELIKADPVIRKKLYEMEEALRKKAADDAAKAKAQQEKRMAAVRATLTKVKTKAKAFITSKSKGQDRDRDR